MKRIVGIAAGLLCLLTFSSCKTASTTATNQSTPDPTYDTIIRNGRIVDGSGNPAFFGDIGIKGGRIAAIGRVPGHGVKAEIDAQGLIVAPGFIDVHTHADEIGTMPEAEN